MLSLAAFSFLKQQIRKKVAGIRFFVSFGSQRAARKLNSRAGSMRNSLHVVQSHCSNSRNCQYLEETFYQQVQRWYLECSQQLTACHKSVRWILPPLYHAKYQLPQPVGGKALFDRLRSSRFRAKPLHCLAGATFQQRYRRSMSSSRTQFHPLPVAVSPVDRLRESPKLDRTPINCFHSKDEISLR